MKTMKSILFAGACALASLFAVEQNAEAAQPTVWTVMNPPTIPSNPALNVPTNQPLVGLVYTNMDGTAGATGYLDALLQSQISIDITLNQTCIAGGVISSTNLLQTLVSADARPGTWAPGPLIPLITTSTNTLAGLFTNVSAANWRYFTFTNIVCYTTNCFVTNNAGSYFTTNGATGVITTNTISNFGIKVMFKGS